MKAAYYTELHGATVIDDGNWKQHAKAIADVDGVPTSDTGYRARDWDKTPLCAVGNTTEFPRELVYDEKTIREIVEEQDRKQASLYHVLKRGPKVWRNQSPSNYCWAFGSFHAMLADFIVRNFKFPLLSPFSVGCPVDRYANRGGWGSQSLERLISHGACEEKFWPSAPIDGSADIERANNYAIRNGRQYDTPEMLANAEMYRVQEWWDFRSRDFLAKCSAVLRHRAVSSGYSWMGHQMCTIRIVILKSGELGCVDLDSYGQGGNWNERVLSRSRGSADDMCSPRA